MRVISNFLMQDDEILLEVFLQISKYGNNEIIVTDENFNVIYHNSKYTFTDNKFNLKILTQNCENLEIKEHFENFKNSANNHLCFRLIFNGKSKEFTAVPLEIHICKIKDKKGKLKGFSIIMEDITQELKNKIQKETFTDILTHDLKNPMRANIQILELILKNKFGTVENGLKNVLEELLTSCEYMNYMADNLIIKYKNEFTLNELEKEKYSITELIKDKYNNLTNYINRKRQKIEIVIKGTIPKVNMDIEEMGKVINNLIINASEQSRENATITIEIKQIGNKVSTTFTDFGYKKTQEALNEIFEEYITCSNKFRKIGFGLELYNCKRIIEAHNGEINAKVCENNRGTNITFTLPI